MPAVAADTALACACCGLPADPALPTVRRATREIAGRPTPRQDYDVGTCAACAPLRPFAVGGAVRAALHLIGRDPALWEKSADLFADAGVDVTGVLFDRGDPVRDRARPPSGAAFAHVSREQTARLRQVYGELLRARVQEMRARSAAPTPEPPPVGASCAVCGVGADLPERWRTARTSVFWRSPAVVELSLCGACSAAATAVGALGDEVVERAFCAVRGIEYVPGMRLPGLRPYLRTTGALDAPASPEPFGWVGEAELPDERTPFQVLEDRVAAVEAAVAALTGELARCAGGERA